MESSGGSMLGNASTRNSDGGFVCGHCNKRFTRVENLRRHERTHSSIGTHVCGTCGRSFFRGDVLSRHAKTHLGRQVGDSSAISVGGRAEPPTQTCNLPSHVENDLQRAGSETVVSSRQDRDDVHPPNASMQLPPTQPSRTSDLSEGTSQVPLPSAIHNWAFSNISADFAIQSSAGLGGFDSLLTAVQPVSGADFLGSSGSDYGAFSNANSLMENLAWDAGYMWGTQDAAPLTDSVWAALGISPQEFLDVGAASAPVPASLPASRATTPPIDQTEEDKWPTNYQPKRPFLIGTSGQLQEVLTDPNTVVEFRRWSRFWLDESTYNKVIASLTPARGIPNAEAFRMPRSLYTVNTLISYYFERFLPQLPILHLPTFQMSSAPSLLIAAIMMIGACQSTLKGARAFCVDLIEVIRRTIADVFEMDSSNLRNADLLHVSLLTAFAGLWSGHQRSFELAELSRGMLINLCRRTRLLEDSEVIGPAIPSDGDSLTTVWRRWVAAESRKRLGLAIFLFDSLFPAFLDMPSYLSQGEMINTILPCDERFWNASKATVWQAQLGQAPIPPAPYFVLGVTGLLVPDYAPDPPGPVQHLNPLASLCIICALYHHIWEFRSQLSVYLSLGVSVPLWEENSPDDRCDLKDGFEGRKWWLEGALDTWHREYYNEAQNDFPSLGGRTLYHLGYIALNTNLKDLFAVSGKFGPLRAQQVVQPLRSWANSHSGCVAASHAIRMLKVLEVPKPSASIYAPISVFVGTLCLWAFVSLRSPTQQDPPEAGPSQTALADVYGSGTPTSGQIMKAGVRYLSGCREWRIGAALAMVLAKMMDDNRTL